MTEETQQGRIEISPRAIATVAGDAVLRCYGVVGVASKNSSAASPTCSSRTVGAEAWT